MIKFSVNLHRGCFGGCAFCTISAHRESSSFHGASSPYWTKSKNKSNRRFQRNISDLGGPSANILQDERKESEHLWKMQTSVVHSPVGVQKLRHDHSALTMFTARWINCPASSGRTLAARCGMISLVKRTMEKRLKANANNVNWSAGTCPAGWKWRLSIRRPCAQSDRKPSFNYFYIKDFEQLIEEGLNRQLIPYFISSHPACRNQDGGTCWNYQAQLPTGAGGTSHPPYDFSHRNLLFGLSPLRWNQFYFWTKEKRVAQRQYFFWYKKNKDGGNRKNKKEGQSRRMEEKTEAYP